MFRSIEEGEVDKDVDGNGRLSHGGGARQGDNEGGRKRRYGR